jgi:two-component system chemotaxis sensor kinase CheA
VKSSESDFIAECEDILEEAGRLLLEIQESSERGRVNPDSINALFRSMHTLKGLAGLFGHDDISDISHSLESLLDDIRLGKSAMTNDAISLFLNFTDTLRKLIATPKEDRQGVQDYLEEIEAFREPGKAKPRAEEAESLLDESIMKVLSEYEEHRLKTNVKEGMGIYMIKPVFPLTEFDTALGELTDRIKSIGELISTMPTTEDVPDGSIGFNLMFGSAEMPDELNTALGYDIEELVAAEAPEAAPETEALQAETAADVLKMSTIQRIWSEMTEQYGHSKLVIDIYKVSQNLERKIEELQDQMLEIRMVPVGQIYRRLSQVIRRYSREVGKKIELNMFGEDTEIDKYLAEEILDPLVHIVRNAIDHGLESQKERIASGKPEIGHVTLKAFQRGNHVVMEVSDDGTGIDPERLKKKALEKGLIDIDTELTEKDMMELIFMPGFSTKEVVSEVSGRGVGLDIVKDKVSSMGGFVDVTSEKGLGTIFSLTLPITLAIIKVLMVRVGSETFGVPLSSISETLTMRHDNLQSIENRKVFNLRGELLPVTWLKNIFGIGGDDSDKSFAVIVGFGERRMGLLVDELIGQDEIVIKGVGEYLDGIKGLAGAAEIGRHEIVLVLDIEGIIEECIARRGALHV